MLLNLLQTDPEVLVQELEQAPQTMSLIKMAVSGGWLMLILLALSIMAIYIFGSRWWAIRNASKIDPHFMNNIHNLIHDGKFSAALNIC